MCLNLLEHHDKTLCQRLIVGHKVTLEDVVAIAKDKDIRHILILRDDVKGDCCSSGVYKVELDGVLLTYALLNLDSGVGVYARVYQLKAATALLGLVALVNVECNNSTLHNDVPHPVTLATASEVWAYGR